MPKLVNTPVVFRDEIIGTFSQSMTGIGFRDLFASPVTIKITTPNKKAEEVIIVAELCEGKLMLDFMTPEIRNIVQTEVTVSMTSAKRGIAWGIFSGIFFSIGLSILLHYILHLF